MHYVCKIWICECVGNSKIYLISVTFGCSSVFDLHQAQMSCRMNCMRLTTNRGAWRTLCFADESCQQKACGRVENHLSSVSLLGMHLLWGLYSLKMLLSRGFDLKCTFSNVEKCTKCEVKCFSGILQNSFFHIQYFSQGTLTLCLSIKISTVYLSELDIY